MAKMEFDAIEEAIQQEALNKEKERNTYMCALDCGTEIPFEKKDLLFCCLEHEVLFHLNMNECFAVDPQLNLPRIKHKAELETLFEKNKHKFKNIEALFSAYVDFIDRTGSFIEEDFNPTNKEKPLDSDIVKQEIKLNQIVSDDVSNYAFVINVLDNLINDRLLIVGLCQLWLNHIQQPSTEDPLSMHMKESIHKCNDNKIGSNILKEMGYTEDEIVKSENQAVRFLDSLKPHLLYVLKANPQEFFQLLLQYGIRPKLLKPIF